MLKVQGYEPRATDIKLVIDCPHCNKGGTFEAIGSHDVWVNRNSVAGYRRCPNSNCYGLVFFIRKDDSQITYPKTTIYIDRSDVPETIIRIFDEAIECYSNQCFIASGMMLRKTLEAICEDKGATGANLHQKLEALNKIIVVPKELSEGMQVLKLLGNDAAHIVAKEFDQIGPDEIEISIEFVKEILKATYQLKGLLNKLNSLRKDNTIV
jgi:hypothetical protein